MKFSLIIADDEPMIRNGLSSVIDWDALGFKVVGIYADGRDIIAHLKREPVDAVLTDIVMSHVSGVEAAKWIHENHLKTQVVLLSGYSDFHDAQQAIAYGVKRYLLKPTNRDELTSVFEQIARELARQSQTHLSENRRVSLLIGHIVRLIANSWLDATELLPIAQEIFQNDCIYEILPISADVSDLPPGAECFNLSCAGLDYRILMLPAEYDTSPADQNSEYADRAPLRSPEALLHELSALYRPSARRTASFQEKHFSDQLQALLEEQQFDRLPEFFEQAMRQPLAHHTLLIGAYKAEAQFASLCARLNVPLNIGSKADAMLPLLEDNAGEKQLIDWARQLASSYALLHKRMNSQLLRSIDELLDRNLSSGITLQDVAAHVYLSPNHLSRLFKEAAGETFSKYAIKHKIEHAKRMLLSSSSKVCDIGAQIGYRDTHYFIRVFKAYTGMSPAEYRRNMRLMEVEKR